MKKKKEKLPSKPKSKNPSIKKLKSQSKELTDYSELFIINNIIHKISEAEDFNSSLDFIMDEALNVVGLEGGTICLINPDDTMKVVVNRETSQETLNDLLSHNVKIGDCLCGNCAKDCRPLILNNRNEVIKYSTREALRGEDIRFHAAFPFMAKGTCFGVLCTFTRTDSKPSAGSLKLLEKIVTQTAISVENISLYEKIKENEKRLRVSTELAKVAVWEYDMVANEMTRSNNHDRLYGLEWQTKWNLNTFLNATHPDDREYSNEIIRKSTAAGGDNQYKFDFRVIYPDQSIHWLSVIGEVTKRNSKGEGVLVHGSLIDITDRKIIEEALHESEEKFKLIFKTSPDSMVLIDDDEGLILDANDQFSKIYGYSKEEVIGKSSIEINIWQDPLQRHELFNKLNNNESVYNMECKLVAKGGEVIDSLLSVTFIKMNNNKLILSVSKDIRELKHKEEEIQKLSQELELRVVQRTAQLQEVNKELESFVYSVSHDLRAPLRSIMGFSEIISKRYKDILKGESIEYFGYILEASKNMANLIDDLLKFSRLAKGTIGKELIDLNEIMKAVVKNLNQDIIDNNAKIEFPNNLPIIKSESALIIQILTNLINNAIIYHRKGINPVIKVSVFENEDIVIIKVIDNGQGIPKEYQEKIFNIFQRLHPSDEYPGTGIGLAIVKKAAAALGGKVTLESEIGKGSIFSIILPKT